MRTAFSTYVLSVLAFGQKQWWLHYCFDTTYDSCAESSTARIEVRSLTISLAFTGLVIKVKDVEHETTHIWCTILFSHDYVYTLDPFKSQLHLVHLARAHFVHATHIPSSFFKHAHYYMGRLWQTTFIPLISGTPSELPLSFLLIRWNMRAFY